MLVTAQPSRTSISGTDGASPARKVARLISIRSSAKRTGVSNRKPAVIAAPAAGAAGRTGPRLCPRASSRSRARPRHRDPHAPGDRPGDPPLLAATVTLHQLKPVRRRRRRCQSAGRVGAGTPGHSARAEVVRVAKPESDRRPAPCAKESSSVSSSASPRTPARRRTVAAPAPNWRCAIHTRWRGHDIGREMSARRSLPPRSRSGKNIVERRHRLFLSKEGKSVANDLRKRPQEHLRAAARARFDRGVDDRAPLRRAPPQRRRSRTNNVARLADSRAAHRPGRSRPARSALRPPVTHS